MSKEVEEKVPCRDWPVCFVKRGPGLRPGRLSAAPADGRTYAGMGVDFSDYNNETEAVRTMRHGHCHGGRDLLAQRDGNAAAALNISR
jgi:hypothetical protein